MQTNLDLIRDNCCHPPFCLHLIKPHWAECHANLCVQLVHYKICKYIEILSNSAKPFLFGRKHFPPKRAFDVSAKQEKANLFNPDIPASENLRCHDTLPEKVGVFLAGKKSFPGKCDDSAVFWLVADRFWRSMRIFDLHFFHPVTIFFDNIELF